MLDRTHHTGHTGQDVEATLAPASASSTRKCVCAFSQHGLSRYRKCERDRGEARARKTEGENVCTTGSRLEAKRLMCLLRMNRMNRTRVSVSR